MNACNPNTSETTIYTSDVEEVKNGEIIEVPMKLSFQMLGEDTDNSLEKSKNIAIEFFTSRFKILELPKVNIHKILLLKFSICAYD